MPEQVINIFQLISGVNVYYERESIILKTAVYFSCKNDGSFNIPSSCKFSLIEHAFSQPVENFNLDDESLVILV
jgi:hypothetical protein